MKHIVQKLAIFALLCLGLNTIMPTTTTFADNCDPNLPAAVREANGCTSGSGQLPDFIINMINVIIGVLGLVAVVVVIYGGIQYMTSAGDAPKVKKAKETILYACIGLIICVLAFAIVNFVIINFKL